MCNKRRMLVKVFRLLITCVVGALVASHSLANDTNRLVIPLGIPGPTSVEDSTGGIIAADVTGDDRPDTL
jgi:hypothetical protein